MGELSGRKVAIVVTDGFEQVEMTEPRAALVAAGAEVELVSPHFEKVRGWKRTDWGDDFEVDAHISKVDETEYDALLLPGGVINADKLRLVPEVRQFVHAFFDAHKPVAAICHAAWALIDADVVHGRKLTSWPSLEADLRNAGAEWVDQEVVVDRGLVTSRRPDDIPAFDREMIKAFKGGSASKVA